MQLEPLTHMLRFPPIRSQSEGVEAGNRPDTGTKSATDETHNETEWDSELGLEELFSIDEAEEDTVVSGEESDEDRTANGTNPPSGRDDGEILDDSAGSESEEEHDSATGTQPTADPDLAGGEASPGVDLSPEEAQASTRGPGSGDRIGPGTATDDAEILAEPPTRPDDSGVGTEAESTDDGEPVTANNRLTTMIRMLDQELEGGIPPGRMLSLVAPPETQSELIVKEIAINRPTRYISTFRPEWEVREELNDHLQQTDDERLLDNELDINYVDPKRLLAEPREYIGDIPKGSNLIIDSINEFELEDRRRYVEFLNAVKEVLWDTGSVGLFYGIDEDETPQPAH